MRNSLLSLVLAAAASLFTAPVSAYEEPAYEVARKTDAFEIRRYAPYMVVEVPMRGAYDDARNDAFRKLFAYISGANRAQQKVDMTVPVMTEPQPAEKIEMTVPVLTKPSAAGEQVMQFVLPARSDDPSAPLLRAPALRPRRVEPQWVASRQYSGRASEGNFRENAVTLLGELSRADITPAGAARFAVYNGPFTPWFMRRNEVLVPIEAPR
jgi:hypothetical protein